ncbi:MAG: MFS transporter, partial [Ardenticatenaceae bacterium]
GGQYIAVAAAYSSAFAILLATRDVGQAAPTQREPVFKNLVGYVQILRENRTLRWLMILTAATEVFGFTHQTLLPVFARDVLGVGSIGLGFMTAVRQGGGILGLLLLANLGDFSRKGVVMFVSAVGFGVGQMMLYLASNIFVFIVVLAFIALCASSADTLYKTLMQANVSNEQRGRAMGSWVLSIGVAPAGHIGLGAIAGAIGAPGAVLINGSVLAFISIATMLGLPRIRRLE